MTGLFSVISPQTSCTPIFSGLPTQSTSSVPQGMPDFLRQHAIAALHAVDQLREHVAPLLQISEVRTIAADHLWMSPCYKQDCVAIHFTWKKDWDRVSKLLPMIEEQLEPFNARPHWGKLFTMDPARLKSLYEKLPEFRKLLQLYDPQGKFRNEFLNKYIFDAF